MTGLTIMSPVLRRCAISFLSFSFLCTYLKGMLPRSFPGLTRLEMCDDLLH
jgi:hypothetical protein